DVAFEQVYEDVEQNGLLSIRLESTVDETLRCPGLQGLRLALGRRNARLRVLPAGRSAKGDAAGSGALETAARQTREVSVQLEWQQDGVEGIDRQAAASGERVDVHRVVADDVQHACGLVVESGDGVLYGLRGAGGTAGGGLCALPPASLGRGRRSGPAQPAAEFLDHVFRGLDQLGAVADQAVAAARQRGMD